MNFDEYQKKARSTAIYPEQAQVIYPTLGMAGESGEVAELVKKWMRDDFGFGISEERTLKLHKEIGDVLWYIANLCTDLGISLDGVAEANLEKLQDRQERGVIQGDGDNR